MTTDLTLRCSCGEFKGVLRGASPKNGTYGICYCNDCQAFAHYLQRATEILDEHGGTDIYQTSPARLTFTRGKEHVACVSLTPRLLRWYTDCCRTPIGNTLPSPQIPFVGVIHNCIEPPEGTSLDALFGPPRFRVHGRRAKGDAGALGAHPSAPLSLMLRVAGTLLAARLRGDHKRSPFFDADKEGWLAEPTAASEEQRARIREARDHSG